MWGFASGDNFSSPEFYKSALACLEFALDRDNLLGLVFELIECLYLTLLLVIWNSLNVQVCVEE